MRDGYLRGALSRSATPRQLDVLAAYVTAGGSVPDAAKLVGIRPSTAKRHLADLRAKSGPRRPTPAQWICPGVTTRTEVRRAAFVKTKAELAHLWVAFLPNGRDCPNSHECSDRS